MRDARSFCRWAAGLRLADGSPLELTAWQRKCARMLYGKQRRVFVSLPRGAGKTQWAGVVCAAHFRGGPLAGKGKQIILAASSHQQAGICFRAVRELLNFQPGTRKDDEFRISDSVTGRSLLEVSSGTLLRAIGSLPEKAMGLQPDMVVLDEPDSLSGQSGEDFYSALVFALGKRTGSRMMCVGTAPALGDTSSFWGRALTEGGSDDQAVLVMRAEGKGIGMREVRQAYGWTRNWPACRAELLEVLRGELRRCRKDGIFARQFAAYRLNRGGGGRGADRELLVSPSDWRLTECAELPPRSGPSVWGVDVGGAAAHTAICAHWPSSGRTECFCAVGDTPSLAERGKQDSVADLWERCARRREMICLPGRVPDLSAVVGEAVARWGQPDGIVGDSYRAGSLQDALAAVGVNAPVELRKLDWRHAGEDVALFRECLLNGKVKCGDHLLLTAAAAQSVVAFSIKGDARLAVSNFAGRRQRARTDAISAAVLAVSLGRRGMRAREAQEAQPVSVDDMLVAM